MNWIPTVHSYNVWQFYHGEIHLIFCLHPLDGNVSFIQEMG